MKSITIALAAAAALLATTPAQAASFLVDYTGTTVDAPFSSSTASITITTADMLNAVGGYDILAASGTVNGETITGLVANPNQPFPTVIDTFSIDNVFFIGDPVFGIDGLYVATATKRYNLWGTDAGQYTLADGFRPDRSNGTVIVTRVPEPASWSLMIAGFGLTGAAARRRRETVRAI